MWKLGSVILFLATVSAATALPAQGDDTLRVGGGRLPASIDRPDALAYAVSVQDSTSPTGWRAAGRYTVVQRPVVEAGRGALFRVATFIAGKDTITDSTVTCIDGVQPVWEISHQPSKTMILHFLGSRVTGRVTRVDALAQDSIDQTLSVGVFNSSDVSLVVASLPLAVGYRALLPTYEYESGGLKMDSLSVLRTERIAVGGRSLDAWVVRVSSQGSWALLWVDRRSRVVLRRDAAARVGGRVARMSLDG
jgi:hypothetical protein